MHGDYLQILNKFFFLYTILGSLPQLLAGAQLSGGSCGLHVQGRPLHYLRVSFRKHRNQRVWMKPRIQCSEQTLLTPEMQQFTDSRMHVEYTSSIISFSPEASRGPYRPLTPNRRGMQWGDVCAPHKGYGPGPKSPALRPGGLASPPAASCLPQVSLSLLPCVPASAATHLSVFLMVC